VSINLSRRTLLRGALGGMGASLALPLLEAMTPSKAWAQAKPPVRVGLWFWGGGVHRERFTPASTGRGFALTPQLLPFAAVKPYLTVVTGYDVKITGTGHHASRAGAVAGSYDGSMYGFPSTPSFEQIAANANMGKTRFRSLEVGVSQRGMNPYGPITSSWNGSPIQPEMSPQALFDRVFGVGFTGGSPTTVTNARVAARRSVLDVTLQNSSALKTKLGAADRHRLEIHLDAIRELEVRLAGMQTTTMQSSCVAPGRPPAHPTVAGREPLQAISRAFSDLLAIALACDLTRSFFFQVNAMQSDVVLWDAGLNEGLHDLTHDNARRNDTSKGITYLMGEYAYLMSKLASMPEGGGTLLDNCCVLGTTDHGDASAHDINDFPFVIGGRAGGALKGDLHVRGDGSNASKVHLTLLQAAGLPVTSFGAGAGQTSQTVPALLT
jgi:hypothetical protein